MTRPGQLFHRRRRLATALAAAAACVLGMPAAAAGDALARARADGVLRVANTQSSPPWSLLDAQGQPTGYDVEVARDMARRMGIPRVVFVADTYKNFVEGLKARKYDVVMNDLTPSRERARQVDFAAPYGVEDFRIFVRRENTVIRGRADLRGKRVGVVTGTTNESWARANLGDSDIRAYDNGGFVYADLHYRRIDAVVTSHFSGLRYMEVIGLPLKEVGPPLVYQLSAPALIKGQEPLRAAISAALVSMRADGSLDRLAKKWLGPQYDMAAAIAIAQRQAAEN
jgi:cystine transport system substrate-binding protein